MTDRLLLVTQRITATSRTLFRVPGAIGLPAAWDDLLFDPVERLASLCEDALAVNSAVEEEPARTTRPLDAAYDLPVRGPDSRPALASTQKVPSTTRLFPHAGVRAGLGSKGRLETRNFLRKPGSRFVTPAAEQLSSSSVESPQWGGPAPHIASTPQAGPTTVKGDAAPPAPNGRLMPRLEHIKNKPAAPLHPPTPGSLPETGGLRLVQHSVDLSSVLSANLADRPAEHVKERLPAPAAPKVADQTKYAGIAWQPESPGPGAAVVMEASARQPSALPDEVAVPMQANPVVSQPNSAVDTDALVTAIEERLRLEYLRIYGTSGGL